MPATVHKLPSRHDVSTSTHGRSSSSGHRAAPLPTDNLSARAQLTLQIVLKMGPSDGSRVAPLRVGMSVYEIAATFYVAADQYYHHPEHGPLPVRWSSIDALLKESYPELFDRIDRKHLMSDSAFHSAWRICQELMRWSGHLTGPDGEPDPIEHRSSVQPRRLMVTIQNAAWFVVVSITAAFVPAPFGNPRHYRRYNPSRSRHDRDDRR